MEENESMAKSTAGRPMIGLALGGGGARGFAHIGVLSTLERYHVPIDCVAGTSIGGVMGAAIAAGMSAEEIEHEARISTRFSRMLRLTDPGFPDDGVLRGQKLQEYFEQRLGARTFADLPRRLALIAVDLNSKREVVLTEGSVAQAIRATIALPGLFTPIETGEYRLVDGGLLNNLPVDAARDLGADIVIAVNLHSFQDEEMQGGIYDTRWLPGGLARTISTLEEAVGLMIANVQRLNLERCPADVIVQPAFPMHVNAVAGYGRMEELIELGKQAAEAKLPEILSCLAAV
jgi:NTE family protein